VTVEKHPSGDQIIRRASRSDICALVNMCRKIFLRDICCQGLRAFARRWWEAAIMSSATELWIMQGNDEVLAFYLLVTDEVQWRREKADRSRPFVLRLISTMCCPVLAGSIILRAIMNNISRRPTQQLILHDRKPETRTWLELLAVGDGHRGQGLAKCLLRHSEARTRALGRKAIGLRLYKHNRAARRLYETVGYQKVSVNCEDVIYSKSISCLFEPSSERAPESGL
jgi:GNAT superfamily N-acetyltransferase